MPQGWDDVLANGGVDLVINGHFHVYHRCGCAAGLARCFRVQAHTAVLSMGAHSRACQFTPSPALRRPLCPCCRSTCSVYKMECQPLNPYGSLLYPIHVNTGWCGWEGKPRRRGGSGSRGLWRQCCNAGSSDTY